MRRRQRSGDESAVGTAIEVAAAVVDATSVPGAGSIFKRLAQGSRAELQRARSVALKAAERTSGMTREEIADTVARNPRLLPLVTRLLHAAGENGYDETLQAMGGAFGEAVQDHERIDDCHVLLASLEDLGEHHARVLRVMNGDPPLHGTKAGWMSHDVEEAANLPRRTTSVCVAALVARGLISSESGGLGGGTFLSITDLGRDVLGVLEAYAAESD